MRRAVIRGRIRARADIGRRHAFDLEGSHLVRARHGAHQAAFGDRGEVLQVQPLLLEKQARKGIPPRELTETYMKQCDGILFLLTRDLVLEDKWHPSNSVAIELEIARKLFPREKRFYLLEEGVKFPTMVDDSTYISFSWDKILIAAVKLAKDLREANLISINVDPERTLLHIEESEAFLLETLAAISDCRLQPDDLFATYEQRFHRDRADFNILLSQLVSKELLEDKDILPNGWKVKIRIIEATSKGLNAVAAFRKHRQEGLTKTLVSLGLIPKTKRNDTASSVPGTKGTG